MCGVTGTIASMVLTALSAASQGRSQLQQAADHREQLRYQQLQEEHNKKAAHEQLKATLAEGEVEADRQRRAAARAQGEQTSLLAARGFALDSGSGQSLLAEGAEGAAYENARIRHATALNAWKQQQYIDTHSNNGGMLRLKRYAIRDDEAVAQSLLGGLNSISRLARRI